MFIDYKYIGLCLSCQLEKIKKNLLKIAGFGDRVRNLRCERGLSQEALAKKIGYRTGVSISNIESGRTHPDIRILARLAEVLDADIHELVTGSLAPSTHALAECLKPCAEVYLSQLTQKLKRLRGEILSLRLGEMFKGKSHAKRRKTLDQEIERLEKEFDTISKTLLKTLPKPAKTTKK